MFKSALHNHHIDRHDRNDRDRCLCHYATTWTSRHHAPTAAWPLPGYGRGRARFPRPHRLDHVMDGRGTVSVVRPMGDHYDGKEGHTDENARQLGSTLKNSIEGMEEKCAAKEQFR